MLILGISALYHDSAAVLINDGEIVAAAQEERFTRIKHDAAFPNNAVEWCLKNQNLSILDLDAVVFYDKPFLTFNRLLETYLAFAPKGLTSFMKSMPLWLTDKLFQKSNLIKELKKFDKNFDATKLLFAEHHLSHAASAYYASPFDDAVVITLDGVGEWQTSTISVGEQEKLEIKEEICFPHSLGLLYSAFTYYLGFKVNSGEYKVMGLAPYGTPKYTDIIKDNLITICDDGSFWLDQKYFNYCTGLTMVNKSFAKLFDRPVREPEQELEQFHMDVAASLQAVTEEIVLKIAKYAAGKYQKTNLCLAGGVALNCVANGKLIHSNLFENIWIQPAAGDAGGAAGAALTAYHQHFGLGRKERHADGMQGGYLGPEFSDDEIEKELTKLGATFKKVDTEQLIDQVSDDLTQNNVVGWFQGKMEFGPRALGHRSILGNPISQDTQKTLNLKIKYRESFRPFAPIVLREKLSEWFDLDVDSPYMLLVTKVAQQQLVKDREEDHSLAGLEKLAVVRSSIPAVTHVDDTARIQSVDGKHNVELYNLLKRFEDKTGCPVLVNTSFNVRGEPIVCTPKDAYMCFMGTEMDNLAIGNFYLKKEDQDPQNIQQYHQQFKLD